VGGHGPFRGLEAPLALEHSVEHPWVLGQGQDPAALPTYWWQSVCRPSVKSALQSGLQNLHLRIENDGMK